VICPKMIKPLIFENDFKPDYIIREGKVEVVKELKKLSKSSQEVWLATDEDR